MKSLTLLSSMIILVGCGSFNQAKVPAVVKVEGGEPIRIEGGESIKTESTINSVNELKVDILNGVRLYCEELAVAAQGSGRDYNEEKYQCLKSLADPSLFPDFTNLFKDLTDMTDVQLDN